MFFLMLDTGNFNLFLADAVGLYNGNIAALSTATDSVTPLLKLFRYDKLNRIKRMQTAGISAGEWGSLTDNFSTEYRYDYNGNILSLQRKDATAQIMHRINYTYNAKNNRLQGITATGINSSTYSYDAIGNLANDSGENIQVSWNAMNKVKQVNLPNNRQLQFSYSPTGQRQIKKTGDKTEYYLHDATGNIMCIYELSGNSLTVKERTIYGSKRIGVYRQRIQLTAFTGFGQAVLLPGSGLVNVLHPSPIISPDGRQYLEGSNRLQVIGVARTTLSVNTLAYKKGTIELKGLSPSIAARPIFLDGAKTAGLRDYELTDHLSNVMAVISDRKLSVDANSDTITDYYAPQVVSFTDYYPFGFPMAERSGNLVGYRFGFNGQEADGEIYGEKTTYAFEYRMQDTRLGRFWSVDPLAGDYPWNSAYAFAENRVVDGMDLEGLEYVKATDAGYTEGFMGPYNEDQLAAQQQYSSFIDFDNTVTYNNETYFNVGQHLYQGADGTISNQQTENSTQVTSWAYTDIQNFDQNTMHTYTWADPTLTGNDPFGNPANTNCASLSNAQAGAIGTNLQGGVVSYGNAIRTYNAQTAIQLNNAESIDYINQQLEAGNAVVVGVNYGTGSTDALGTDHYITITGRTSVNGQGRFLFMENAVGNAANARDFISNRLTPSNTGITGSSPHWNNAQYRITRVQRNQ